MSTPQVHITETLHKYIESLTRMKQTSMIAIIERMLMGYVEQFKKAKKQKKPGNVLVKEFYRVLDDLIKDDIADAPNNPPSCRKGCSSCCNIRVDATKEEAMFILDYLQRSDIELSDEQLETAKAQVGLKPDEWAVSPHRACMFLKNNECSIYDVRPAACRSYHVVSDPAMCDATKYKEGILIMAMPHSQILRSAFLTVFGNETMSTYILNNYKPKANGKEGL